MGSGSKIINCGLSDFRSRPSSNNILVGYIKCLEHGSKVTSNTYRHHCHLSLDRNPESRFRFQMVQCHSKHNPTVCYKLKVTKDNPTIGLNKSINNKDVEARLRLSSGSTMRNARRGVPSVVTTTTIRNSELAYRYAIDIQ